VRRFLLAAATLAFACRRTDPESPPASATPAAALAVPVVVGRVARTTLSDIVSAPGKTAALSQEKVRAPFAGSLTEFKVADGDRVRRGDRLATIVSRDSESALAGAREMAREAKTDSEKADAARALELAERGLVRAHIDAPADGVVLTHAAVGGDRVSEDQEILTIADASSVVFLADVPQSDLGRIRPGQSAQIEIAGRATPWTARVHDTLPTANAADFTAAVRLDPLGLSEVPPVGLFGTARIIVGEHRDALAVPEAALVRDDLTGKTRIALVDGGHARWIEVTTGLHGRSETEVLSPKLQPGQPVVVSGQVGLPEAAAVAPKP
jgi:membrane fusion protein, multidrug efflux system